MTSIVSAKRVDLRGASQMKIGFRVCPSSSEPGGSLIVEFSNDGGSSWQTAKRYEIGKELTGAAWQAVIVVLEGETHELTSDMKARFRVEGISGKKRGIYLDNNIIIARSKD